MAYIGRDVQYGVLDKQTLTADSSTTVFTLSSGVSDANSLLVSVGGVIQEPDVAYTATGTVLTFTAAPITGTVAYLVYLGKELTAPTPRDDISFQTAVGDGTATPFVLTTAAVSAQSIMVMLNGVTQVPDTDYTVSSNVITFTTPPSSSIAILVYHLVAKSSAQTISDSSITDAKIVTMNVGR